MYTIIKKLLKQGWIYLQDGSDSRRKVYELTNQGKVVLKDEMNVRKLMVQLAEEGLGGMDNE